MKIKRLKIATIVVVIISLLMAGPVLARIAANTIDDTVTLSPNNRQVLVTGPITCTQGEKLTIDVVVVQRSTGAVVKGSFRDLCTGEAQNWEVNANTMGSNTFEEGPAIAWAVATTRNNEVITDAAQWAKEVTVVK
jgi:hypothetical protein